MIIDNEIITATLVSILTLSIVLLAKQMSEVNITKRVIVTRYRATEIIIRALLKVPLEYHSEASVELEALYFDYESFDDMCSNSTPKTLKDLYPSLVERVNNILIKYLKRRRGNGE